MAAHVYVEQENKQDARSNTFQTLVGVVSFVSLLCLARAGFLRESHRSCRRRRDFFPVHTGQREREEYILVARACRRRHIRQDSTVQVYSVVLGWSPEVWSTWAERAKGPVARVRRPCVDGAGSIGVGWDDDDA